MSQRRLPYEPALDGVRGLAVLAVMVFHALPLTVQGGFLGVDVFFSLSGYLITRLLLMEYDSTQRIHLLAFYKRRWLRLGPALMLMLLVYGLGVWLFSAKAKLNDQGLDILLAMLYLSNWARALHLKDLSDLGHTWSLAIEEQFYLLWPLLLWFLLRTFKSNRMLLTVVIALALLSWAIRQWLITKGAHIDRAYNGLDTRAENLMWGAALAVWMRGQASESIFRDRPVLANSVGWIALACLLMAFMFIQWTSNFYYLWGISGLAVVSCVLIFHLHEGPASSVKSLLENPALVWLGTTSYGLYLWHHPVYRMLASFGIKDGLLLIAGVLITIPIAALSYYLMERPLLESQGSRSHE